MADRLSPTHRRPESAVAAEYDRARRPRAREKARAQSRGAPGEEARWDPTEPGSADPRGANRTVHVKTLGGRRVVSRGRSRHGDRALRREGRAPGHRERALRRHGNGRVRPLSKATASARPRHRKARPRQPPRARNAKNEAFALCSSRLFSSEEGGGASAPNARHLGLGHAAGRPAPARHTRRDARAGPSPPGTASPRPPPCARGRSATSPTSDDADTCAPRRAFPAAVFRCSTFQDFFFLSSLVFPAALDKETRTAAHLCSPFACPFAAPTRAAAGTGRARPRRLCSRTWLRRAPPAWRPRFEPRARRRAPTQTPSRRTPTRPATRRRRRSRTERRGFRWTR